MTYPELKEMPYDKLQELLLSHFPGKPARGYPERLAEMASMPTASLLVLAEYQRRNMVWGRNEYEITTYEDAVKHLTMVELLSRLDGVNR